MYHCQIRHSTCCLPIAEVSLSYRLWPAQLTAASVIATLGYVSHLPEPTPDEVSSLASSFHFSKLALPATSTPPTIDVHPVNPVALNVARWLSSVGTSLSLGDLDEDGLSNEFCAVEPRTGEIRIAPVPDTGARFPLFTLRSDLALDPDTYIATGCKFGDFNEDGLEDLLVHYIGRTPLLFLRHPGPLSQDSFTVQPLVPTDTPWWTSTILQMDVDGDGHLDLVVGNYFPDGQQIFGKNARGPVTMHDTFARARNGGTNRILLWKSGVGGETPSAHFEEIPNPFPEDDATAWTLALGAADLDQDGLSDLYVANDFGPDQLYHNASTPGNVKLILNKGESGFFIPTSRVLGEDSFKGMGVDFGDVNGDGFFDIFVSNITVHGGLEESHFLFLSDGKMKGMDQGKAPYTDHGEELGLGHSSWAWDTRMVDFDNDGDLELMQATGFLKGQLNWWADLAEFANSNDKMVSNPEHWPSFPENIDISGHDPEPFYTARADGSYVNLSQAVGFDGEWNARGLAVADVDGDGDADLALANQWEDSWFFRNDLPVHHASLGLHLQIHEGSTALSPGAQAGDHAWPAIGAMARIQLPDGKVLIRQVDGGNGHSGASAAELLFGLGDLPADQSLPVHLRWRNRSGQLQDADFTLTPGNYTIFLQG